MNHVADADYKMLMSDLIKKQMIMLGPSIAIARARKVPQLKVADDGGVEILGDPRAALEKLYAEFVILSGHLTQSTFNLLLEKYPKIKQGHV